MDSSILIAVITGLVSSVATVVTMRVDIGWIKRSISKIETEQECMRKRIFELEKVKNG